MHAAALPAGAGPAKAATAVMLADRLPLTCTRAGTCCHGKEIWINPWELACLAVARGCTPREFRDRYTADGGVRLRVDGPAGWRGLPRCSQYEPAAGCAAHAGRPLACRLYPLGRTRQKGEVAYFHEGERFPCLDGCPAVVDRPSLTVAEYLAGQEIEAGVAAQDAYLELTQDLAEGALVVEIQQGTSAAEAGIKPGDLIIALDGVKIRTMDDLILEVRRSKVGEQVALRIYRGASERTLQMTVGTKPKDTAKSE